MSKQSVLFLLDELRVGGSEVKTVRLANRLVADGYKVGMAYWGQGSKLAEKISKDIILFDSRGLRWKHLGALWRYRFFFKKHQFDNVFAMGPFAASLHRITTSLAGSAHKAFVCINMSIPTPKVERRMPVYRALCANFHAVFGAHSQAKIWTEEHRFNTTSARVLHNGVDVDHFSQPSQQEKESARSKLGYKPNDLVVGIVAALRPEKAVTDLVEAIAWLKERGHVIHLLVIGDGIGRKDVQSVAQQKGVTDFVNIIGFKDDIRPYLAAADMFGLCSRSVETFSNAALEAMSMGLPVVLSDIGGAKEMVNEGVNGYLFPAGNVEQLAKVLEMLVDGDSRRQMGVNARQGVASRFSIDKMVAEYIKLIEL